MSDSLTTYPLHLGCVRHDRPVVVEIDTGGTNGVLGVSLEFETGHGSYSVAMLVGTARKLSRALCGMLASLEADLPRAEKRP